MCGPPHAGGRPEPTIYERGYEPVVDDPGLPRVLLIGDSISEGYTFPVRQALRGKANVHRIATNARHSRRGLSLLDTWLGDGNWDVVHFNFGLHDVSRTYPVNGVKVAHDQTRVPPDEYGRNLREVVARLRATGAVTIWASTTAVPPRPPGPGRRNEDVVRYNRVAANVMRELGVPVNDLYELSRQKLRDNGRTGRHDVHFDDDGYLSLGTQVAAAIAATLNHLPGTNDPERKDV